MPFSIINQKFVNMKGIKLHLRAAILFAPVIIGIMSSIFVVMLLGVIYFIGVYLWSSTINGRKFFRSYYREILRLERML